MRGRHRPRRRRRHDLAERARALRRHRRGRVRRDRPVPAGRGVPLRPLSPEDGAELDGHVAVGLELLPLPDGAI
ncbi:MAG: hypothetical protein ACK559_37865, partial [bacterium]